MPNPTQLDAYRVIRSQIERETDLIHHRLSWLLSSEAFLIAAYAVIVTGLPTAVTQTRPYQSGYESMHTMIPVLGIVFAVLAFVAIAAAIQTTMKLRAHAHAHGVAGGSAIPTLAAGWTWRLTLGTSPALLSPIAIIAAWTFLLANQ